MASNDINKLLKTIDAASAKFNSKIPAIEKKLLDELSLLMKEFEVRNGKIVSNMANLKLMNKVKGKLEKLVFSKEYIKDVADFVHSFSTVAATQNDYFKDYAKDWNPKAYQKALVQSSMENTVANLSGAGVNVNVLQPVMELLRTAVTSGQSYSQLEDMLRKTLTETEGSPGSLSRYAKTYTVDSISQFSGEYMAAITKDLDTEWYVYRGSNIETTREFCEHLTKKEYVHKSEIPEILKEHIDGHKCKIYDKTGLPYGMKEGTNVDNFQANRGGWNCQHQLIPVHESYVPENIRKRITNNDITKKVAAAQRPREKALFATFEPISAAIIDKLSALKDNRKKQKLLHEIVDDERFKSVDMGLSDGGKTTIAKGSKINTNKKNTLQLAKELNKRNISVTFLPESNEVKSADAIITYNGKLMVADLKFSNTTKANTLYSDLKDGFRKAPMVVLKLKNMDLGVFRETITQLVSKKELTGGILLVNDMGNVKLLKRDDLLSGRYKKIVKGFL